MNLHNGIITAAQGQTLQLPIQPTNETNKNVRAYEDSKIYFTQ